MLKATNARDSNFGSPKSEATVLLWNIKRKDFMVVLNAFISNDNNAT